MNTIKDLGCPIGLCNNDSVSGGKKAIQHKNAMFM